MEVKEIKCEILNRLFEANFDEILQKIFLNLDPSSLKNCKCVCSEWFEFIQKRLWNSRAARKQLRTRLTNQWKFSEPFINEYDHGMREVYFLVCDDELIVCGYKEGMARVYEVSTGELKFKLKVSSGVQLDLGKNVIGTLSDNGNVSIWNRKDGTLLYQDVHHGEYVSVYGIKVTDEYILTGAGDGSLFVLESIEGDWKITHKLRSNKEEITHIDADGKWAVTGTRKSIKLWDLEEHKLVENIKPVQVNVWMLSFLYPHAFVVGFREWNGIQIWDMVKCTQIRNILQAEKAFPRIYLNGLFLAVPEFHNHFPQKNNEKRSVVVYDVSELIDTKVATKHLWKKNFEFSPGQFEQISAALNTTSLVVCHASKISISNFWRDQKCSSKEISGSDNGRTMRKPDRSQVLGDYQ